MAEYVYDGSAPSIPEPVRLRRGRLYVVGGELVCAACAGAAYGDLTELREGDTVVNVPAGVRLTCHCGSLVARQTARRGLVVRRAATA